MKTIKEWIELDKTCQTDADRLTLINLIRQDTINACQKVVMDKTKQIALEHPAIEISEDLERGLLLASIAIGDLRLSTYL